MNYYYSVNSDPTIEIIGPLKDYLLHNIEDCENLAKEIVKTGFLGHDFEDELKDESTYENIVKIALYHSETDTKPFFETEVLVLHDIEVEIKVNHSVNSENSMFRI